jgi:hypothetical protein
MSCSMQGGTANYIMALKMIYHVAINKKQTNSVKNLPFFFRFPQTNYCRLSQLTNQCIFNSTHEHQDDRKYISYHTQKKLAT